MKTMPLHYPPPRLSQWKTIVFSSSSDPWNPSGLFIKRNEFLLALGQCTSENDVYTGIIGSALYVCKTTHMGSVVQNEHWKYQWYKTETTVIFLPRVFASNSESRCERYYSTIKSVTSRVCCWGMFFHSSCNAWTSWWWLLGGFCLLHSLHCQVFPHLLDERQARENSWRW